MVGLQEHVTTAGKTLKALEEIIVINRPNSIERDAAIHRFERTYLTVWQAAKQMLRHMYGIDASSPKDVIRKCREVGLFSEGEAAAAMQMVDDRNRTYDETLADETYERLSSHVFLLRLWLKRIKELAD